jgi:hypothetical protein
MKKIIFILIFLTIFPTIFPIAGAVKKTTYDCDIKGSKITCSLPYVEDIFNSVQGKITLHGTDYLPNESATVFLQLLDGNEPINGQASCFLTIFNPNKTILRNYEKMAYLKNSNGIYYLDWTVPSEVGVYIYDAVCWYKIDESKTETADNYVLLIGDLTGGTYLSTTVLDGVVHKHKEKLTPTARLDMIYNFTDINYPFYDALIEMDVNIYYKWNDASENIDLYLYNYNTSSWDKLDNSLTITEPKLFDWKNNTIYFAEFPKNYVSSNTSGEIKLRLTDSDWTDTNVKELQIDYMEIKLFYSTEGTVTETRGSSEGHVLGLEAVCNNTSTINFWGSLLNSTINEHNSSVFWKLYKIQDEISSMNETQNSNFQNLNQNIQNNFSYTNSLINGVNNTVSWWGGIINGSLSWWGNLLNSTMNFWGNSLEEKINGIIMGNVTVTALVDYDEIAMTVMQYLKALQKQELI